MPWHCEFHGSATNLWQMTAYKRVASKHDWSKLYWTIGRHAPNRCIGMLLSSRSVGKMFHKLICANIWCKPGELCGKQGMNASFFFSNSLVQHVAVTVGIFYFQRLGTMGLSCRNIGSIATRSLLRCLVADWLKLAKVCGCGCGCGCVCVCGSGCVCGCGVYECVFLSVFAYVYAWPNAYIDAVRTFLVPLFCFTFFIG